MTGRKKGLRREKLKRLDRRVEARKAAPKRGLATALAALLRRNCQAAQSALIFAILVLVALFAYDRLTTGELLQPVLTSTARATGFLVNVLGGSVEVHGFSIVSQGFTMNIVDECTGILPIILFLCAVIAFPSKPAAKVAGGVIGTAALLGLNLVRTSSLFFIGTAFPSFLDVAHYLIWQSLMILAAIFLWLVWVGRLSRVPQA